MLSLARLYSEPYVYLGWRGAPGPKECAPRRVPSPYYQPHGGKIPKFDYWRRVVMNYGAWQGHRYQLVYEPYLRMYIPLVPDTQWEALSTLGLLCVRVHHGVVYGERHNSVLTKLRAMHIPTQEETTAFHSMSYPLTICARELYLSYHTLEEFAAVFGGDTYCWHRQQYVPADTPKILRTKRYPRKERPKVPRAKTLDTIEV